MSFSVRFGEWANALTLHTQFSELNIIRFEIPRKLSVPTTFFNSSQLPHTSHTNVRTLRRRSALNFIEALIIATKKTPQRRPKSSGAERYLLHGNRVKAVRIQRLNIPWNKNEVSATMPRNKLELVRVCVRNSMLGLDQI